MDPETEIWASRLEFGPQDWNLGLETGIWAKRLDFEVGYEGGEGEGDQVAQGQYVVSDTRCPACMIVKWSERKKGSGPKGDDVLGTQGDFSSGPEGDKVLQNTGIFVFPA